LATVKSFRELVVWQRAIELTLEIYKVTKAFPKDESFGLTSQLRRAAVSVASNIAEGQGRKTKGEFVQFLCVARGSNAEVQTQLVIAQGLGYSDEVAIARCEALALEVAKMLNGMLKAVSNE
jgi:four helix bundle protein